MTTVVNTKKCDGCGICVDECAAQAITIEEKIATIDKTKCSECETCFDLCPSEAIDVR